MTRIFLIVCLTFAALPAVGISQDKDRAKTLRAEIAELKKKLDAAETELARLEGLPYVGPVKPSEVKGEPPTLSLRVGTKGSFGKYAYSVVRVGDNFAIVQIRGFSFLVSEIKTDQIAVGGDIQLEGEWEVRGTTKFRGQPLFDVVPRKGGKVVIK